MSKVLSYTPEWLSQAHPGHKIFAPSTAPAPVHTYGRASKHDEPGPRRTIVRRGTEVFAAVGREIRWADLVYLKQQWEEDGQQDVDPSSRANGARDARRDHAEGVENTSDAQGVIRLTLSIADDIKQLVLSPNEKYLAVLTTYTVHIVILPDSSRLPGNGSEVIKPKTYQLGPTTHVTSREPISTALWHPLGVNGSCLVTITKDAKVRLWELAVTDHWSFDKPTLSIDLVKLINLYSIEEDARVNEKESGKVWSPDTFELQVASACFAARNTGDWASMTLWIATRFGSVYALCPLLPQKWSPPAELLASLSISIAAKTNAMEDEASARSDVGRLAQQQLAWLADLDNQEPVMTESQLPGESMVEVYSRPQRPGAIPKLQGPLQMQLAPEEDDNTDIRLSDIMVVGGKLNVEELMFGEEEESDVEDDGQKGLSASVVVLSTSSGRISVYLDTTGLQAQWLPNKADNNFDPVSVQASLLHFETLETLRKDEQWSGCWPTISLEPESRYSFYVTSTSSLTSISLTAWAESLEAVLQDASEGSVARIDTVAMHSGIERHRLYTHKLHDQKLPFSALSSIDDADLGHILITHNAQRPVVLCLREPTAEPLSLMPRPESPPYDEQDDDQPEQLFAQRPAYHIPHAFQQDSSVPGLLRTLHQTKHKRIMDDTVRLSPATLAILAEAHSFLSRETHQLSIAAADLFRKCDELRIQLEQQLQKVVAVEERINSIGEGPADADEGQETADNRLGTRIRKAQDRQNDLATRLENVRVRAARAKRAMLSDKEKAWLEEMTRWEAQLFGSDAATHARATEDEPSSAQTLGARYKQLRDLVGEVLEEARGVQTRSTRGAAAAAGDDDDASSTANDNNDDENAVHSPQQGLSGLRVGRGLRGAKVEEAMKALERETALVDAATLRLEGLTMG